MLKLEAIKLDADTTVLQALTKLDSKVRFSKRGPTMKKNGEGGFEPEAPGFDIAEVIDSSTGEIYARGEGGTAELALVSAVTAAKSAPKPLTKAQKADPAFTAQAEEVKALRERIAALEAGGATANGTAPPKNKGGRPRKHPIPADLPKPDPIPAA